MKDFLVRVGSIFIAAPAMAVINLTIEFMSGERRPSNDEATDCNVSLLVEWYPVAAFSLPVYIVLGIPVSYLVDYISKRLSKKLNIKMYVLKLTLYTFVCGVLISLVVYREDLFTLSTIQLIIIPVLTGFHALYFLENKVQK